MLLNPTTFRMCRDLNMVSRRIRGQLRNLTQRKKMTTKDGVIAGFHPSAVPSLSLCVQNADSLQFASKVLKLLVAGAKSLSRFNERRLREKEFAIDIVSGL